MSLVEAAAGMDRLPWLPDEPVTRPARRRGGGAIASALGAVLLVGGAAFWFGVRPVEEQPSPSSTRAPATTVRLPEAQAAPEVPVALQPEINPAPPPEVRPTPAPQVRLAPPPPRSAERETVKAAPSSEKAAATPATERPASRAPIAVVRPQTVPLKPWQPRVVSGAAGRLVEVGAFGSVPQAKRGWRYMVRAYPAMTRLPAVVRPDRNSKGRIFYRFRVGTTSQAHSEVLCQRMQRIRLSCAVIDLPGKAKVER